VLPLFRTLTPHLAVSTSQGLDFVPVSAYTWFSPNGRKGARVKRLAGILLFTLVVSTPQFAIPAPKAVGGWGQLELRFQDQDTVWVVTTSGTPYQMGYWYGKLLAPQVAANLSNFLQTISSFVNLHLLSVAAHTLLPYVPTRYLEMMQGLADACSDYGHPEITLTTLKQVMAVPDLSESGCSLFAASAPATNGHTYQMRNLDWNMTTGLQRYPVVAIFLPTDAFGTPTGQPHATVGFAGVFGAIAGLNAAGLAVSEIAGYFHDREILAGEPMLYLLWDVLWQATSVAEAESLILHAQRTNMYYYACSDPSSPGSRTRLFFTGHDSAFAFPDGVPVYRPYLRAGNAFYTPLPGAIYWKNHNGSGNELLYNALREQYGSLDDEGAITIARKAGVPATLVSAVTDATDLELYVSFAKGEHIPAHVRKYVRIELQGVFGTGTPSRVSEKGFAAERDPCLSLNLTAHPNPFNAFVTLAYNVDPAQPAEIAVFDATGRRVAAWKLQGPQGTVRWEPGTRASGIYLVRLQAGPQRLTQRLVYLK